MCACTLRTGAQTILYFSHITLRKHNRSNALQRSEINYWGTYLVFLLDQTPSPQLLQKFKPTTKNYHQHNKPTKASTWTTEQVINIYFFNHKNSNQRTMKIRLCVSHYMYQVLPTTPFTKSEPAI